MPKASQSLYNDLQTVLTSLRALEVGAQREGDHELEGLAKRARRELALKNQAGAPSTPALKR